MGDDGEPESGAPASDDIDLSGLDMGDDGEPESGAPASDDIDLSGLDIGDDCEPESGAPAADDIDLSGLDMGDDGEPESGAPASDDLDLSGLDMGDDGEPESGAPASDDLDLSGLDMGDDGEPESGAPASDDIDLSGGEESSQITDQDITDEEKKSLFPDNNLSPAEDSALDTAKEAKNGSGDAFEDFNLDDLEKKLPDINSFDIPGVDAAAEKPVKAISLTEEELQSLMETLSKYPLNVRIACEEAIAEQVVPPAQLNSLIKLLVSGGNTYDAARLVSKILDKKVAVPKGYRTGEEFEEERRSFGYIFINKFLPVIRLFMIVAALAASVSYLFYQFIYKPVKAEGLYQKGYELIGTGVPDEYPRANQYFKNAFAIHRVKNWFYKYAERFRDERQYTYAAEKYDELLRYYPHDKKGALDYALLESGYQRNYEKADKIIRTEILDYSIDDYDGLLALGDINLNWAEIDPSRYEEARAAYARLLEIYGYTDPVLERMMLYFIRTDKLFDVLPLQYHFMNRPKSKVSPSSLAELGGYLLDKRLEVPTGVPDENVERIEGIKDVLLRAEKADTTLPEPHYHLARYYNFYGAPVEERFTLEAAAAAFDAAAQENAKRTGYRIDTQRRLAKIMTGNGEFDQAEHELVKGINVYEDAVNRRVLPERRPEFGRLYADLGDIDYFTAIDPNRYKESLETAARYYLQAEANGWMPVEIEYRLGYTYYNRELYPEALSRFFDVSRRTQFNRRLLYALANAAFKNADFYAAEAYYKKLLDVLRSEQARIPGVLPDSAPEHYDLIERLMCAQNNMGVTKNALAMRTGAARYHSEALVMVSEAIRCSDSLERDQTTMVRPLLSNPRIPGMSRPYLNMRYLLYPVPGMDIQLFQDIDLDILEPSDWEKLTANARKALAR
jgi:tetratricopeptide (TPR) repeat protein